MLAQSSKKSIYFLILLINIIYEIQVSVLNSLFVSSVLTPTSPLPYSLAIISLSRSFHFCANFTNTSTFRLLLQSQPPRLLLHFKYLKNSPQVPGLLLLSPTRPAAPKSSRSCPRLRLWLFFAEKRFSICDSFSSSPLFCLTWSSLPAPCRYSRQSP